MQYETIILELLSRVQKLEEEVASLKNSNISINEHSSRKNIKVTPEMTKLCYEKAKEIYYNSYCSQNSLLLSTLSLFSCFHHFYTDK